MKNKSCNNLGEYINKCAEDALTRLRKYDEQLMCEEDLEIYSWPQTWGNTACGFGGMAGQMITAEQAVVIIGPSRDACVYHGRFAYKVKNPSASFGIALHKMNMPGEADKERRYLENYKADDPNKTRAG